MNKVYPSLQENEYNSNLNTYARINPEIRRKREEKLDLIEKTNIGVLVDLERRLDKITSAIRKLKHKIKHNKRKKACIICYEKLQRVILVPCKHSDFCFKCVQKIIDRNGLCPLCRTDIHDYIKL
jgi:hypothetical protein